MTFAVRAVGTASTPGTATPHTVATPASVAAGELLVTVFEYATGADTNHISLTGWTELGFASRAAATGRTAMSVMGRISDGTEGASEDFAVAGTINHVSGRMCAIPDHGLANIAAVVSGTSTGGAAGGGSPQTNTLPGITVTAGSLILMVGTTGEDATSTATFSNWTNANLTGIGEHMDNVNTTGNGGGYGMASGFCAGTTTGDSTYDQAILYAWNGVHIGIKPVTVSNISFEVGMVPIF